MPSNEAGSDDADEYLQESGFRAILERYENAPDQCTIFPAGRDPSERVTTWITAEAPSFVDLWEYR
jgi:hypothetical protein